MSCYRCNIYTSQKPSIFIREKSILSSEKDYDKGSVAKKNSDHEPQDAWRQDEPIGGKPPVVQ
jgi:hypothetical protein